MTMGGNACSGLGRSECMAKSECLWVINQSIAGGRRAECDLLKGRMSDETMPSMDSLLERILDTEVLKAVSQNRWAMDDNQME